MTWVEPKSSKKAVSRAGDKLINSDSSEEEKLESLDIVSNWRSSYTFTLHIIASLLRSKVKNVEKNAIITGSIPIWQKDGKKTRIFAIATRE
ncbi:hypothetical protein [Nostoc commune]|uniref:hypothetical protein n=1 Tax=Nostoc commune TaxID=1178 RepID=UPI0018C5BF7B|nr:hypothetical protein [Nostoc commune]MBG1263912.1 hypothetical protein [Nostoc commune BAE]